MSFIIASHNNGESARRLSELLNCRLMSHSSSSPLPKSIRTVINMGCNPDHPVFSRNMRGAVVLNTPHNVVVASSKEQTFRQWDARGFTGCVNHWFDRTAANYACLVDGKTIVARTLDRASSGRGIEVITPDQARTMEGLPAARVYTEAIDKGREYRVHVGYDKYAELYKIIDVTRKIRRPDAEGERGFIWNHDNDFIFVREGVTPDSLPISILRTAVDAVRGLGLHFGAVDIVVPRRGRLSPREVPCYALEVNTAPGMEGTTLERYAEFFRCFAEDEPFSTWQRVHATGTSDTSEDETFAIQA